VTFTAKRPLRVAFQEEQLSILQALRALSNGRHKVSVCSEFFSRD